MKQFMFVLVLVMTCQGIHAQELADPILAKGQELYDQEVKAERNNIIASCVTLGGAVTTSVYYNQLSDYLPFDMAFGLIMVVPQEAQSDLVNMLRWFGITSIAARVNVNTWESHIRAGDKKKAYFQKHGLEVDAEGVVIYLPKS